jgi:hypothetical protein
MNSARKIRAAQTAAETDARRIRTAQAAAQTEMMVTAATDKRTTRTKTEPESEFDC